MLTKVVKYVSIVTLLLTAAFWSQILPYELIVRFTVGLGALLVAIQAVRAKRYYWSAGFFAIAVWFNPFATPMALSGILSLIAVLLAGVTFAVSLAVLKTQPLLSIPSITDRTPGSRSL